MSATRARWRGACSRARRRADGTLPLMLSACASRPSTRCVLRSRARCRCSRRSVPSPEAWKTRGACTAKRRARLSLNWMTRHLTPTTSHHFSCTWTTILPPWRRCSPPCSRAAITGCRICSVLRSVKFLSMGWPRPVAAHTAPSPHYFRPPASMTCAWWRAMRLTTSPRTAVRRPLSRAAACGSCPVKTRRGTRFGWVLPLCF